MRLSALVGATDTASASTARLTTMHLIVRLSVAVALVVGQAVADEHGAGSWSYAGATGPSSWGKVSPEYATCGVGKRQSPIDIESAQAARLPAIQFNYTPSPLMIVDNGHTIQVNYAPGSFIIINSQRYELVQFHFHRPSEEHVHGRGYPMVAHLVHKNAKGELAVVAVLLREGKPNSLMSTLWAHIPSEKGHVETVAGEPINVAALLPDKTGYYTFDGSLTTPPCSERVSWFVLKTPTDLSGEQVAAFAERYANNARPVQPINGRMISETID
jgi:carbonic anhydrase